MRYDEEKKKLIFQKTDGKCHICHKKLAYKNYGIRYTKGCWEVEHSIPKAKNGTDHLNNLYPACIECNRDKKTNSTRSARNKNGKTKAPYSREKKESIQSKNRTVKGLVGTGIGLMIGGPIGGVIGAGLGYLIGDNEDPEKTKPRRKSSRGFFV